MPEAKDISTPKEVKPKTVKPRAVRKPKPLVEGINAPVQANRTPKPASEAPTLTPLAKNTVFVKTVLTDQEKKIIAETPESLEKPKAVSEGPRLLSPKAVENAVKRMETKKKSGLGSFLLWLLFFLVLGLVLYKGYDLYNSNKTVSQQNQPEQSRSQINPEAVLQNQNQPSTTPTASSALNMATTTVTASSSPVAANPEVAPNFLGQLKIKATPTGYLKVRSMPSPSGSIISKVQPGEIYYFYKVQSGWYLINLQDGKTGWVSGQYASVVSPTSGTKK